MTRPLVCWVARMTYPGRKPFWVGNVRVPDGTDEAVVEEVALARWRATVPEGTPEPAVVYVRPGETPVALP